MSRPSALALVALLAGLTAYCAAAGSLPEPPEGLAVAVLCFAVLPAFAGAVWLALPLAQAPVRLLLAMTAVATVGAVALSLLEVDSAANIAKLTAYALFGFTFLAFFEEVWWLALVAALVPLVDVWSVVAGPTEYVVEEQPGIFQQVAVALPSPGETVVVSVGPPDVVFFALFLGAAARFGLRAGWTWVGMTAFLAGTLALVWSWDDVAGLPALPAVCLGFLAANADLLWRSTRSAWTKARSSSRA